MYNRGITEDFSFAEYCQYVKCAHKLRLGDRVQLYVLEHDGHDYFYQSRKTNKLSQILDVVGLDNGLVLFGCKKQCGELYSPNKLGNRKTGTYVDDLNNYFVWWGVRIDGISGRIAKLIR